MLISTNVTSSLEINEVKIQTQARFLKQNHFHLLCFKQSLNKDLKMIFPKFISLHLEFDKCSYNVLHTIVDDFLLGFFLTVCHINYWP